MEITRKQLNAAEHALYEELKESLGEQFLKANYIAEITVIGKSCICLYYTRSKCIASVMEHGFTEEEAKNAVVKVREIVHGKHGIVRLF